MYKYISSSSWASLVSQLCPSRSSPSWATRVIQQLSICFYMLISYLHVSSVCQLWQHVCLPQQHCWLNSTIFNVIILRNRKTNKQTKKQICRQSKNTQMVKESRERTTNHETSLFQTVCQIYSNRNTMVWAFKQTDQWSRIKRQKQTQAPLVN